MDAAQLAWPLESRAGSLTRADEMLANTARRCCWGGRCRTKGGATSADAVARSARASRCSSLQRRSVRPPSPPTPPPCAAPRALRLKVRYLDVIPAASDCVPSRVVEEGYCMVIIRTRATRQGSTVFGLSVFTLRFDSALPRAAGEYTEQEAKVKPKGRSCAWRHGIVDSGTGLAQRTWA